MNPEYVRRGINITIARSLLAIGLSYLAASTALAQEAADNVVIVLDASGSMSAQLPGAGKDKMSAAKAALKEVLKSVPQETHIGLLVFSARGANNDWFYPLGPRDDAKLMQAIDRPMPGGNTPLGKYIKIGADRLLEERAALASELDRLDAFIESSALLTAEAKARLLAAPENVVCP